jgi:TraY domain
MLAPKAKSRGGRPRRREPRPGERVSLGLRVTPECKARLDAVARASGRSQSQEAELRIESSFRDQKILVEALDMAFGSQVARVLQRLGQIMISIAPLTVGTSRTPDVGAHFGQWMNNAWARQKMIDAAIAYLSKLRPNADELAAATPAKVEPAIEQVYDLIIDAPEREGLFTGPC